MRKLLGVVLGMSMLFVGTCVQEMLLRYGDSAIWIDPVLWY